MTSQLNVDTIVDKAGSSGPSLPNTTTIKVGNTSTYVSDGGAVTQNTVQGLAKQWMSVTNTTVNDSLNLSSISDGGDYLNVYLTNNMSNDDYSISTGGSQSGYATNRGTAIGLSDIATASNRQWAMTEAEAGYASGSYLHHTSSTHGDLA